MQKCLELSQLPKSHGIKSVRFKRTTPGSINQLAHANKPPAKNRVLDPSHPALDFTPTQFARAFPWRTYPGFSIRAVPKGLLERPATVFPNPPFATAPIRNSHVQDEQSVNGRVSMSLMNVASKSTGGRVLRVNVHNKLKTAISLVAARGATVEKGKDGQPRIVFKAEEEPLADDWVLSDWTYICRPSMEINRMPFSSLVPSLRSALRDIVLRGKQLERQWYPQKAVASQKAPQSQARQRTSGRSAPADLLKQAAEVERLIGLIEPALANPVTNTVESSSEPSPDTSQEASSSPSAGPSSVQQTGAHTKGTSSARLDSMLRRIKSRLSAPPSSQATNTFPAEKRVMTVTTGSPRTRTDPRSSSAGLQRTLRERGRDVLRCS
ncbi:hypothetical protein C8T65DRAFT_614629 [Cerioporus squamosus]|nr:hypothetical protein C8T65DRAFT_614629 [Cerioporus squamosus]